MVVALLVDGAGFGGAGGCQGAPLHQLLPGAAEEGGGPCTGPAGG